MRILFTGGSGFLGTHLIAHFAAQGHEVLNLSRKIGVAANANNIAWSGKRIPDEVGPVDVIINLAGAGIADGRWTDKQKKLLRDSRIFATQACTEFIQRSALKPKLFLSSSGINYYGGFPEADCTEESPAGNDFMGALCAEWEAAAAGSGVRTVWLRTSVVLGSQGGALQKMVTPFKWFVGGPVGSGNQFFPWIHVADFVKMVDWMIYTEGVSGPVNMVAPQQITHREFAKALGKALHRPAFMRLPKAVLKLLFGEMSIVLWGGVKARSKVLPASQFQYPDIDSALSEIFPARK